MFSEKTRKRCFMQDKWRVTMVWYVYGKIRDQAWFGSTASSMWATNGDKQYKQHALREWYFVFTSICWLSLYNVNHRLRIYNTWNRRKLKLHNFAKHRDWRAHKVKPHELSKVRMAFVCHRQFTKAICTQRTALTGTRDWSQSLRHHLMWPKTEHTVPITSIRI